MGLFSNGKDKAKEKIAESLKWPYERLKSGTVEKYYKQKGRIRKGECAQCGRPINTTKSGYIHKKCVRAANGEVSSWKSSHEINNTLYFSCGVHNRNAYTEDHHNQICG